MPRAEMPTLPVSNGMTMLLSDLEFPVSGPRDTAQSVPAAREVLH